MNLLEKEERYNLEKGDGNSVNCNDC